MRYINGDIDLVSAVGRGDPKQPTRAAQVTYANGSIGTFINSMVTDLFFHVNYLGSKGRAVTEDICGAFTMRLRDEGAWTSEWKQVWEPAPTTSQTYSRMFGESLAQFVQAVKGEVGTYADGLDGLRHMEIDAAMTESMDNGGKPVKVERYLPTNG